MNKMLWATALLLLLAMPLRAGDAELLFEAGNRAYLDGDWDGALGKWKQIEELGFMGGQLYYNIGNASFKAGKLGEAILYWEKAARILGEDGDIQTNLKIARARVADKLDTEVRLPVWDWFDSVRDRFPLGLLTWLGVLLSLLTFGVLALGRWGFRNASIAHKLKPVVIILAVSLTLDLGMIVLKARDEAARRQGVFIVTEAEVLSAPAVGSGKLLFTLHEGTTVRVLRSLQGWHEIFAGKDKQGWVRAEELGVI